MTAKEKPRQRVVLICPGRGSYGPADLASLSRPVTVSSEEEFQNFIKITDGRRSDAGDPSLTDLDSAKQLTTDHTLGEHVSPLIFACTAADFLRINREHCHVVAIAGNSLGWYSALFCAGALTMTHTMRLVEAMSNLSRNRLIGGQLIYPVTDDQWRTDKDLIDHVEAALRDVRADGYQVGESIRYGGYRVLWGDDEGIRALCSLLREQESGGRNYPLVLHGHSAFHSPLLADNARQGIDTLTNAIEWRTPRIPLIDGRGHQWSPLATNTDALAEYTLRTQVTSTFDFTACIRVALREYAPDLIVCLGPGDVLGAPIAQIIIQERWQGITDRNAFLLRQQNGPFVVSFARREQRLLVTAP